MSSEAEPGRAGERWFRMPAEWETHAATMLIWPSSHTTWPGPRLGRIREFCLELIHLIHRHEPVLILVSPDQSEDLQRRLRRHSPRLNLERIRHLEHPVNDLWARDCGPVMVRDLKTGGSWTIVDWDYNAWGGKYPPWEDDNRIPGSIAEAFGLPACRPGRTLEGGAIEPNGEGWLLTTASAVLNPNRNPDLSRSEAETLFQAKLGADTTTWLEAELPGDDTDGHVDNLARFAAPDRILLVHEEWMGDHSQPDPPPVRAATAAARNLERIRRTARQNGRHVEVEWLPQPVLESDEPTVDGSHRLPASYANFYLVNGGVLVPRFGLPSDEPVLERFSRIFPDRRVTGVNCRDLVWGQGGLHCITQPLFGDAISDSYCR